MFKIECVFVEIENRMCHASVCSKTYLNLILIILKELIVSYIRCNMSAVKQFISVFYVYP